MAILKKGCGHARNPLLATFFQRSILPSSLLERLSSLLGYDAMEFRGALGREILVAGLNLFASLSVAITISIFFIGLPLHSALAVPLAGAILAILPWINDAGSGIKDLFDAAHSFEVFAAVLLATGNLALATSKAAELPGRASGHFRKAIISMRSGVKPERALFQSFNGKGVYSEWVRSAVSGREGGISPVISNWYAELQGRILKAEDMLSLTIALSTILPIGLSMVMAVWGFASTPLSPLIILAFSAALTAIFCWFKGLEAILS